MKKFIFIWIALLVILGLIASIYLIPSKEEEASYNLKSQNYSKAAGYYQEQYDKGVRTLDVTIQLSRLNEEKGNLKAAIQVLEKYNEDHPNDFAGLTKLADLYHLNLQFEEYFKTLMKIQKLKGDGNSEVLQELALQYQNINASEPLQKILEKIVSSGKGEADDYLNLAYLYAVKQEYGKASSTLETARKLFPKKQNINNILFEVWTNIQGGKARGGDTENDKKTVKMLADYLNKKNSPALVYYAIGVFSERYSNLTLDLIDNLNPDYFKDPRLEMVVLKVLWKMPLERKAVFPKLMELYKAGPLDPQLQELGFEIFLDKGDEALLTDFIEKNKVDKLEERSILNFAIFTIDRNKPNLAKKMQTTLGDEFLKNHPLMGLALAMGAQEKDARKKYDEFFKKTYITQFERLYLLKLASAMGYDDEVLEVGAQLPPYLGLDDYELIDIALAYIKIKKAEKLYQLVQNSLPSLGEKKAMSMLLILDVALQHPKKVAQWLEHEEKVSDNLLSALYTAAEDSKEYPLALYIAKRRLNDYPTTASEAEYALALVQVGEVEEGLSILKRLIKDNSDNEQLQSRYFIALSTAVKKNPQYKDDLLAYIKQVEAKGPLSNNQLRDFAFIYLDVLHDYTRAIKAFQILAVNSPPDSPEVQNLIYLSGPKVSPAIGDWIEDRARNASPETLGNWLEYLLYIDRYNAVIEIFQARECEIVVFDKRAYMAYMDALSFKQNHPLLREVLDRFVCHFHLRKDLEKLASLAEGAIYFQARKEIWESIAAEYPNDPKAWQNFAKAAFDLHDYCAAGEALEVFFDLYVSDGKPDPNYYLSLYEYGEVLRKQEYYDDSDNLFWQLLGEIECIEEETPRLLEVKALLYDRLKMYTDAQNAMERLFDLSGRDSDIAAGYMTIMMDEGSLNRARRFYNHFAGGWCDASTEDAAECDYAR